MARDSVLAGHGPFLLLLAEGQGFEPWRNVTTPSGFQGSHAIRDHLVVDLRKLGTLTGTSTHRFHACSKEHAETLSGRAAPLPPCFSLTVLPGALHWVSRMIENVVAGQTRLRDKRDSRDTYGTPAPWPRCRGVAFRLQEGPDFG
jgi:hypothetical protein